MHTETAVEIRGPAEAVFRLAAAVERWPEILPHYRRVRVLASEGNRRLVEMAASRDGIPVHWRAEQEVLPESLRIRFRHVAGVTRGMEVEWRLDHRDGVTRARIVHDLDLRWPLIGGPVARWIIGPLFVENIAGKTLRRIKALVEAGAT
ncbi:MAG TPA: SRPBCC family protein [Dehalococcoidia bacterium]